MLAEHGAPARGVVDEVLELPQIQVEAVVGKGNGFGGGDGVHGSEVFDHEVDAGGGGRWWVCGRGGVGDGGGGWGQGGHGLGGCGLDALGDLGDG